MEQPEAGRSRVPGGYFGRALVVDVGDGSTRVLPLPERVLRDHLGGVGLGTWLLTELGPPGVDPLSPRPRWPSSSRRWSVPR